MSASDPIVLVFGADDQYARPLTVSIYSTLANIKSRTRVVVYILDGGISNRNKHELLRVLELDRIDLTIEWIIPDKKLVSNLPTFRYISAATYLRLFIPDLVPAKYEKVIYLDSDIVVEGDLTELWDLDMEGQILMAVQCFHNPYVSSPEGLAAYRELGMTAETPYFNAGILVMNLKRWRDEAVTKRVFEYLDAYRDKVCLLEQDGLNATLWDSWIHLDPRWNRMVAIDSFDRWPESSHKSEIERMRSEVADRSYIIHFTGSYKPWLIRCANSKRFRYFHYLRKSGWYGNVRWSIYFLSWVLPHVLWLSAAHVTGFVREILKKTTLYRYVGGTSWYRSHLRRNK